MQISAFHTINGKLGSYIAQYSTLRTAKSALYVTTW